MTHFSKKDKKTTCQITIYLPPPLAIISQKINITCCLRERVLDVKNLEIQKQSINIGKVFIIT
jgi:hypothetical protein